MEVGDILIVDKQNHTEQYNEAGIDIGDWFQLYFEEDNPAEVSTTQAFIDGDFWVDGNIDDENSFVCHLGCPYKIVKL